MLQASVAAPCNIRMSFLVPTHAWRTGKSRESIAGITPVGGAAISNGSALQFNQCKLRVRRHTLRARMAHRCQVHGMQPKRPAFHI